MVKFIIAIFFLLMSITLGIFWHSTNNKLEEALQKIQQQTVSMQEQIVTIQEQEANLMKLNEDLDTTREEMANMKIELETTMESLVNTQQELGSAQNELINLEKELQLYKETWGSVVASGVEPFFTTFKEADMQNNSMAINVTWSELKEFLKEDDTDRNPYVKDVYMCGEFALDIHNNAEEQGIRAAWVAIKLEDGEYHALNAFKTIDKGLVFIDCTGLEQGESGPNNLDTSVNVKLGNQYKRKFIFPSDWISSSMGEILDVEVY